MFAGQKVSLYDTSAVPGYPFFNVSLFFPRNVTTDAALGSIAGLLHSLNRVQISFLNGKLRFIRVGSATVVTEATIVKDEWYCAVCVGRSPNDAALILDGQVVATSSSSVTFPGEWTRISIGNYVSQVYPSGAAGRTADAGQALSAWVSASISNDEARSLSINPWKLFRADPVRIYSLPSAGTEQALAASGSATATGTAQLAAGIAMAGVGVALASGSGKLAGAQSAPLTASGAAAASGTAAPRIDIALSALGLSVATGTATLDTAAAGSLAASGSASARRASPASAASPGSLLPWKNPRISA